MPYLTLTLSGYPVDLPADAQVALSYRVNDLRSLDSREAAFSETLTLPPTAQNRAVLGNPHDLHSLTTTPYRLLPAVLRSPGGAVLLHGFGVLESSSGPGFELTLTDAAGALFAVVGNRGLRELDLTALDHLLTYANVQAADANTYTQGYTYALADTGVLAPRPAGQGVEFDELPAAVFVHALLLAMLSDPLPPSPLPVGYVVPPNPLAGYRLTGSLLADERYQRTVLPRATAFPQLRQQYLEPYTVKAAYAQAVTLTQANASGILQFPDLLQGPAAVFSQGMYAPPTHPIGVHVEMRLPVTHTGNGVQVVLSCYDTTTQGFYDIFYLDALPPDSGRSTLSLDYTLPLLTLKATERLIIRLGIVNNAQVTIAAGASIRYTLLPRAWAGAPVHLDASLPAMSQADLLKLVFNQFNVILQADPITKTLRLDLFNDVERRRNQAVDWTDRLDLTQPPRVTYRLEELAQRNLLQYAEAPDAYTRDLALRPAPYDDVPRGRGTLPVVNATLPVTAETLSSDLLLPLPHTTLAGRQALAWLPFFGVADTKKTVFLWAADHDWSQDQLVLYQGVTFKCTVGDGKTTRAVPNWGDNRAFKGDQPWEATDDFFTTATDTLGSIALLAPYGGGVMVKATGNGAGPNAYNPARQLSREGLGFADLLSGYYPTLIEMLARLQLVTVDLRLTALDIVNLDFTRPVRLGPVDVAGYGRLSGLFYLNYIDQYQPGNPGAVAVELLRLGLPVPGLAPPVGMPTPRTLLAFVDEDDAYYLLSEAGEYLLLENQ